MDPITTELEAGIAAARAGNKEQARSHLTRVLAADPRNETAWLWLSGIMPTTEQALRCIERLLEINPHHQRAKEAQEVLRVRLLVEEAAVVKQNALPSTPKRRYLLGEALVEAGVITSEQLEHALQYQADQAHRKKPKRSRPFSLLQRFFPADSSNSSLEAKPMRLGEVLVHLGMVRPRELEAALAAQMESIASTVPDTGLGRIGDYLVKQGLITPAQLHQGLALQAELKQDGRTPQLGEVLVRMGYLRQEQLTRALLQWHEEFEIAFR